MHVTTQLWSAVKQYLVGLPKHQATYSQALDSCGSPSLPMQVLTQSLDPTSAHPNIPSTGPTRSCQCSLAFMYRRLHAQSP